MKNLIEKLKKEQILCADDLKALLSCTDQITIEYLSEQARNACQVFYGHDVFMRGLIEFTNYCKNDCYYCGIRKSNLKAERYRLSKEQIINCCYIGYKLGFRTFVLQGGEDNYYIDDKIVDIVSSIKKSYPDCAVTLSIGEKSYDSYQAYFDAGADRYLLRHETANDVHYSKLHPPDLSLENRKQCLYNLKSIGYQVGCGFMVGSPHQTLDNLVEDLQFIKDFQPQMVGIGPFIPHQHTPFAKHHAGTLDLTLKLLSIIRLINPRVLLPATTALNTIEHDGYKLGMLAGANVIMLNLSPPEVREKYLLYDNKTYVVDNADDYLMIIQKRLDSIGYKLVVSRGDYKLD